MPIIIKKKPQFEGDDEELFTLKQTAAKLQISTKMLMKHVELGNIRYINLGTAKQRCLRFTRQNMRTFIENKKTRETPKCLSTKAPKAHSISMTSSWKGKDFMEVPKPPTKKKH